MSEIPYDAGVAFEQYLSRAAVPVALAAACWASPCATCAAPGRTCARSGSPPRIRCGTSSSPSRGCGSATPPIRRPARADLLAIGLALLLAAGASALIIGRVRRYEALGRMRFAAEHSQGPAPTSADVVPGRWRVEGTIGPGRRVTLAVTAELRNLGTTPRAHLAFELDPLLEIAEARAGEGGLTLSRSWDRLAVELTPPIPPAAAGSSASASRRAGDADDRPADLRVPELPQALRPPPARPVRPRAPGPLEQLPGAGDLAAPDPAHRLRPLAHPPLPALEAGRRAAGGGGVLHPAGGPHPRARDPPGLFLADACGGVARSGRLASNCRLRLADLAGGRLQLRVLPAPRSGTTVAVYPAHAALGELHLGSYQVGTAS